MSREIKFRAWVETNQTGKQMVDLYKITPFALDSNLQQDGLFLPFSDGYKLMQFTGLHDKNGVEIYEGDLLRRRNGDIDAVSFRDGCFQVHHKSGSSDFIAMPNGFEVAGNVYENPELLEAK